MASVVDQRIVDFLQDKLGDGANSVIVYMEGKDFSFRGQVVVASIFAFAKECGVSVGAVITEADKEWIRNWQYQHADIRGDTDAPGAAGIQNRASLENIYSTLGIPSPVRG